MQLLSNDRNENCVKLMATVLSLYIHVQKVDGSNDTFDASLLWWYLTSAGLLSVTGWSVWTGSTIHDATVVVLHVHSLGVAHSSKLHIFDEKLPSESIWVRSRNCDCLVTWFCYQLIAKPGNKTVTVSWADPYIRIYSHYCGITWASRRLKSPVSPIACSGAIQANNI